MIEYIVSLYTLLYARNEVILYALCIATPTIIFYGTSTCTMYVLSTSIK